MSQKPRARVITGTLDDFEPISGSADDFAEEARPSPPTAPPAPPGMLGTVSHGLADLWAQINPAAMWQGALDAARDPVTTVRAIGQAQGQLGVDAKTAYDEGDYLTAGRKGLHYLLPVIGPALDAQSDKGAAGDVAGMVGGSAGLGLNLFGPTALARSGRALRVPAVARNSNPAEASAVAFADRQGIPVDAATASGSRLVQGVQAVADRGTAGAFVADRARGAQTEALTRVGGELANRAHPAAVSPEQAGQAVRGALRGRIHTKHREATAAYEDLRTIEADPAHRRTVQVGTERGPDGSVTPIMQEMALPVDLRGVKATLTPVYARMTRQLPITQQRSSPGLRAIENIVNGPDYAPLSQADTDLSIIKGLSRDADPQLRSLGEGLAARAVQLMQAAVDQTAAGAGLRATTSLTRGRTATVAKYATADVLKQLRKEPVQVFSQATWAKDAGIQQLQEVAKLAPGEMPKLARAYLDDLMTMATAEGGFDRGAALWAKWSQLGPRTKAVLFRDRALVRDLDDFFLLAKKVATNPNPSGSGYVLTLGAGGTAILLNPLVGIPLQISGAALSKALRTRAGVKLLTQGLRVKVGNRPAAAATAAQLARLAGEEAAPMRALRPAAGEEQAR